MKKVNKKIIDNIFLIAMSVQTILMGTLFLVQICRIYFAGNGFAREICIEYIKQISSVIIIWIIMIIASYIYFYIRNNDKKVFSRITYFTKYKNLKNIVLLDNNDEFNKIEKKIKIAWIINIVILVLCSIMGLCYLLNPKHFDSSGNPASQAVDMAFYLLPWVIVAFASFISCVLYEEHCAKIGCDVLKVMLKNNGKAINNYKENKRRTLYLNIARATIIIIAVVLIIVGSFDGGVNDVFHKAINICTECIGLG